MVWLLFKFLYNKKFDLNLTKHPGFGVGKSYSKGFPLFLQKKLGGVLVALPFVDRVNRLKFEMMDAAEVDVQPKLGTLFVSFFWSARCQEKLRLLLFFFWRVFAIGV